MVRMRQSESEGKVGYDDKDKEDRKAYYTYLSCRQRTREFPT